MSLTLRRCTDCGAAYFPARLVCRACGGDRFVPHAVEEAVVEETTELTTGVVVASARVDGVLVVGALTSPVPAGTTVPVDAVHGRADALVVPDAGTASDTDPEEGAGHD